MLDLVTGGGFNLAVIGGIVLAVLGFIWKVFSAGRTQERAKSLQKSNKQWVEADDIIGKAQDARRRAGRVNADSLHDDDGFKRP